MSVFYGALFSTLLTRNSLALPRDESPLWHLPRAFGRPIVSSLTEDYRMLGSDKAIIGALAILIIGIVVSVVLIG